MSYSYSYNSVDEYTCQDVFVNFKYGLGSGSFGKVFKGRFNGYDVAVKVIGGENWESVKEMNRMAKACASGHENIINLLGCVPPENHFTGTCHYKWRDTTWLVMEYMEKGNLYDYLRNYAGGIPAHGMIKIAYQVARGMDHLHRSCNLLHMDLAARNVLVQDDDFNVKIGDFGLCRNFDYSNHYYDSNGNICPVRWMSPENLPDYYDETPRFSRKGDVWSFGILLFELWSRGKLPFAGYDDQHVIDHVNGGKTVLDYQQVSARSWVIDLMKRCMSYNKENRPNFRQIYKTIQDYMEPEFEYDESQDDSYDSYDDYED